MDRRHFLLSSGSAFALTACSASSLPFASYGTSPGALVRRRGAANAAFTRLEIEEFSAQPALVAAFRTGVKAMKAILNDRNTRSWNYWHYSHWMPHSDPPEDMAAVWDQCKHAQSFFLPWHRGFLYYFEKVVRAASGNPHFALPYWDYYKNPNLPNIFAAPKLADGSANPLYFKRRTGSVMTGLSYAPYAGTVTVFPFGPGETFEDLLERNPHNRVHDQIGGAMGSVPTAVADPIFWVHHANIDRLWSAWVAAGGKRKMPAESSLWWYTTFFYDVKQRWRASVRQVADTKNLGYVYDDLSLPVPPSGASLPLRPISVATAAANVLGPVALTLQPVTVEIPVDAATLASPSLVLTLDGVTLTGAGRDGGYDYGIYVNLPAVRTPLHDEPTFAVDQMGSFTISMAEIKGMKGMPMHGAAGGATLAFPLAGVLHRQREARVKSGSTLRISFVPFGRPSGVSTTAELVRIGAIRLSA